MILLAKNFEGWLDVSANEVLGSTEYEWLAAAGQFRRSVKAGDCLIIPDEYYRFPNIKNAVDIGYLEIIAYDARPEQIVIHAELPGAGIPGTKYLAVDIHGGEDTAIIQDINDVPSLVFEEGCNHRSKWTLVVPKDYVAGTPIYVQAYWTFPNGEPAQVRWFMEHKAVLPGEDMTDPAGSVSYIQQALASDKLYTTGSNLVIPPADLAANKLLMISVRRTALHADDTLDAPVYIHLVKLNYTGRTFSS